MKLHAYSGHFLKWLLFAALSLPGKPSSAESYVIHAARVFDGYTVHTDAAVLILNDKVVGIGKASDFTDSEAVGIELGDATLLPGFIELHAHLGFRQVPADVVLRHGITTLRDVGGPLHPVYGGDGHLRVMTSGPIITAPEGYPIPSLGDHNIAVPVASEQQARETVRSLVAGGAKVIKVALEPGGESGAPWSSGHGHHEHTHAHSDPQLKQQHVVDQVVARANTWPLLSVDIVKAIVDEAHKQGLSVTTHIAEARGAQIALDAGIDEWAHAPCMPLPEAQLKQAAEQKVKVVTTIDTLAKCPGIFSNVERLKALGVEFFYGAEIAHADIPWGIDAQELLYLQQFTGMQPLQVLNVATAKAGAYLGIPLLGTLLPGAPADLIAVKGDPTQSFKLLEYPGLVISGGKIVANEFTVSN